MTRKYLRLKIVAQNNSNAQVDLGLLQTFSKLGKAYKRAWELQLQFIEDERLKKLFYQSKLVCNTFKHQYELLNNHLLSNPKYSHIPIVLVESIEGKRNNIPQSSVNLGVYYGTARKRGRPAKVNSSKFIRLGFDSDTSADSDNDIDTNYFYKDNRCKLNINEKKLRCEPKFTPIEDIV